MIIKKIIANELRKIATDIENGNCNLSSEEMYSIFESVSNVYLNKEEACKLLNMSRPTFDRMVHDGRLPEGKKKVGYKQLVWNRGELLKLSN